MLKKLTVGLMLMLSGLFSLNFTFAEVFGAGSARTSGINIPGSGSDQGENFITVVKNGVNYVLVFLGLIVFIFLLWGGFLMISAAGDDGKYKKGFAILKQAGIGLIFIGIAWIVISFIINMIGLITA